MAKPVCTCGECDPDADPRFTGPDFSRAPGSRRLHEQIVRDLRSLNLDPERVHLDARRSCYCRSYHWTVTLEGATEKERADVVERLRGLWKTPEWEPFSLRGFLYIG